MKLTDFASEAATKVCSTENKQFDPTLVLIIIQVVLMLVKECRKTPTLDQVRTPTFWERWRLKRIIRKQCSSSQSWVESTNNVWSQILKRGQDLTEEEYKVLKQDIESQ